MLTIETDSKPNKAPKRRARKPVNVVKKGWGGEVWIANNELYCGKLLRLDKGKKCSLHYHKLKTESFYLHKGRLLMRIMESLEATEIDEFELEGRAMHGYSDRPRSSDGRT